MYYNTYYNTKIKKIKKKLNHNTGAILEQIFIPVLWLPSTGDPISSQNDPFYTKQIFDLYIYTEIQIEDGFFKTTLLSLVLILLRLAIRIPKNFSVSFYILNFFGNLISTRLKWHLLALKCMFILNKKLLKMTMNNFWLGVGVLILNFFYW